MDPVDSLGNPDNKVRNCVAAGGDVSLIYLFHTISVVYSILLEKTKFIVV
jgi:hypothetical protein